MRKIAVVMSWILLLTACGTPSLRNTDTSTEEISNHTTEDIPPNNNNAPRLTDDGRTIVKLVVPEGYTLPRIGMRLEEMGICTTAEFITATQQGDYSEFPLIAEQSSNSNRCFQLEGYLFPATYDIYIDSTPDEIIRKMLATTEQQINPTLRQQIQNSGYSVDEILALASIIEKEAFERNDVPVPQEMPKISSVLHNRLEQGMPLQCDVTINYVEGAIKPFIEGDINRFNEYYNTYKAPGLPAGAICNPGIDAIVAAISPAQTDYLFFLTDHEKNFYYSSTYEEHEILVAKYLTDDISA